MMGTEIAIRWIILGTMVILLIMFFYWAFKAMEPKED